MRILLAILLAAVAPISNAEVGTHVMHLERNRKSLYQSVLAFIGTVDEAFDPAPLDRHD